MSVSSKTTGGGKYRLPCALVAIVAAVFVISAVVLAFRVGYLFGDRGRAAAQQVDGLGPVVALAYRLEGSGPLLSAYIGDRSLQPYRLPAGRYHVEALLASGEALDFSSVLVADEGSGSGLVDLEQRERALLEDPAAAGQIQTLARFLVALDHARLTYFSIASQGFTQALFAPSLDPTWTQEKAFMDALQGLGDPQQVGAAAQALALRAENAQSALPRQATLHRPTAGLIDSLLSIFGVYDEEAERARQEVLDISVVLTNGEKEEAFEVLDESQRAGARNFDEFLQRVQAGEVEDPVGVRRDLMQFANFAGAYQDLHPESNRPTGEIIHRVGAELVERGAEFEVEAVKHVLQTAFPGMEQGFDYAQQANDWIDYIHNIYTDPLGAARDELESRAQGAFDENVRGPILDRIKSDLLDLMPDLDDEDAAELAGLITDQAIDSIQEQAERAAEDEDEDAGGLDISAELTEMADEYEETETPEASSCLDELDGKPCPARECIVPASDYGWSQDIWHQLTGKKYPAQRACNTQATFTNYGVRDITFIYLVTTFSEGETHVNWHQTLVPAGGEANNVGFFTAYDLDKNGMNDFSIDVAQMYVIYASLKCSDLAPAVGQPVAPVPSVDAPNICR